MTVNSFSSSQPWRLDDGSNAVLVKDAYGQVYWWDVDRHMKIYGQEGSIRYIANQPSHWIHSTAMLPAAWGLEALDWLRVPEGL